MAGGIDAGSLERNAYPFLHKRNAKVKILHVRLKKLNDKARVRTVKKIGVFEPNAAHQSRVEPQRPMQQNLVVHGSQTRRKKHEPRDLREPEQAPPGSNEPSGLGICQV